MLQRKEIFAPSALHFPCTTRGMILSWWWSAGRWTRQDSCSASGALAGEFLFDPAEPLSSLSTFRQRLLTSKKRKEKNSFAGLPQTWNAIFAVVKKTIARVIMVMLFANDSTWLSCYEHRRKERKETASVQCYATWSFSLFSSPRWSLNGMIVRCLTMGWRLSNTKNR